MKKTALFAIVGLVLSLNACGKKKNEMLVIAGSDTMVQLGQNLAKNYMQKFSDKKVSVQGGGSGTGIAGLINGSTQIANASRKMKGKEYKKAESKGITVKEHIVGFDGIAVVVNPKNPVKDLTIEQLSGIFKGAIKNWKEVGGNDEPILAVSRENNSGTHVYFKEEVLRMGDKKSKLEFGDKITYAVSSQQIIDQIKTNPQAIGYVGMGWVNDQVKALNVAKKKGGKYFPPNKENVLSNNYPVARTLQMYVNTAFNEKAEPFIQFVMGPDGQKTVSELGFVPVTK